MIRRYYFKPYCFTVDSGFPDSGVMKRFFLKDLSNLELDLFMKSASVKLIRQHCKIEDRGAISSTWLTELEVGKEYQFLAGDQLTFIFKGTVGKRVKYGNNNYLEIKIVSNELYLYLLIDNFAVTGKPIIRSLEILQ